MQAWIDYHNAPSGTGDAQKALWRAHQRSLHWGIDCYEDLLAAEEGAEQEFIRYVVENVDISSLMGFPSDEWGAVGMYHFLEGMIGAYPRYGEVTYANANVSIAPLLLEDPLQYGYLVGANIIGLDSGWYWATRF